MSSERHAKDLAAQVAEAVEILLERFDSAGLAAPREHVHRGIVSLVLRVVFLRYAEDLGLRPGAVRGLHAELVDDARMHPESMHQRFTAHGRLLALARGVFEGDELPSPPLDDGVVHALLERLFVVGPLDIEQLGSVYESLQPGAARRRSGSHYTPRELTERVVRRTLAPILASLGPEPSEVQLLSLGVCDPAMGCGAFLLETCRQLADQLVAAWARRGELAGILARHGDALVHARRLVAQRCLYGVDKDATAVALAKLSLWLLTMSRELPFTFVDHALHHGDSLVGLDLDQISRFDWQAGTQPAVFGELAELPIAKVRLIADACVGAFFAATKDKARELERVRRKTILARWLGGEASLEAEVQAMAAEIRARHAPFHWWLELPATRLVAIVGNPPFGGKDTLANQGPGYRDMLKHLYPGDTGVRGNCDVSAYFMRRAAQLLGTRGTFGLISTNTIAQGDTRSIGLQQLVREGWTIYEAERSLVWPGRAAVMIGLVHAARGLAEQHVGRCVLDGQIVTAIDSRLRVGAEQPDARVLASNRGAVGQGAAILGIGFTLTPAQYHALAAADAKNLERMQPYLGGEALNTNPDQSFDRYVIDFGALDLDEARQYPDLLEHVRIHVKPMRDKLGGHAVAERRKTQWWRFAGGAPELYESLRGLDRCLVASQVTKHLAFAFQPTTQVFAHTLNVFTMSCATAFAVLQSRIHEVWARLHASSLEDRMRYAARECFETFPFPAPDPRTVLPTLESIGQAFHDARARTMLDTQRGLTKTYNAMKDPACSDAAVLELRQRSEAMDRAVLDAYGWTDLEVPPFCPCTAADRRALAELEHTLLDRLTQLNAARAGLVVSWRS